MDDLVYQVTINDTFTPFRRNIQFLVSRDAAIQPLIPELSFIKNKHKWGSVFRFGMLEILHSDFERIAACMLSDALELIESRAKPQRTRYGQKEAELGEGCG
jgi:hypothetical protein